MKRASAHIIACALACAVLFVLVAGCGDDDEDVQTETETDVQVVERDIEEVNARFESFIAGQQWDSLSTLYTVDAIVMPQGAPMEQGADPIRDGFMQMGEAGVTAVELQTEEVERQGDMAYEVGRYILRGDGGQAGVEMDRGKYLSVWKLVDGEWRIHREMFNSDGPGAPGAAELPGTTGAASGDGDETPGDTLGEGVRTDQEVVPAN